MQQDDIFSRLTPEQLHQLLALSTVDEEGGLLEKQLAQAQALRSNYADGHVSPLGTALGGIGDILNASQASQQSGVIHKQQQELIKQQLAGRNAFVDLLRQGQQAQQQPAQALGPTAPVPGMPFGGY